MESQSAREDDLPSLLNRSHISTSVYDHDLRFDNRNSEDVHKDALAAAQAEHDRVREIALRAFQLNELRESQLKLQLHARQEEERIRIERERALEAIRIRELENKAKQIPKPPPRLPTPPPIEPPAHTSPPVQPPARVPSLQPSAAPKSQAPPPALKPAPTQIQKPPTVLQPTPQPAPNPFLNPRNSSQAGPASQDPAPSLRNTQQPTQQQRPAQPTTRPPSDGSVSHVLPDVERYAAIHKRLKELRRYITDLGKQNPAFKKKTGEMRRAIRQSVGQLTGEKGANKVPMKKIVDLLKESLESVPSPGIDPSNFMVAKPDPIQGGANNGDTIPALFLYLLNIFSKMVVLQFIDEAGASPKTADPIGVVAVSVFSRVDFFWRSKPLIDILISKIRVVCPVLFGLRGNEKTEEGRARLGWKKNQDGDWVSEQFHSTRMAGLGVGYAALCLRDFSKSRLQNPWPPTHYWQAIASIVSTPPEQTSSTQYMVLKALIENSEQKFMNFYGNAARAALRAALVDFPGRALEHNVAVSSLEVLADKLKRDMGLDLRR